MPIVNGGSTPSAPGSGGGGFGWNPLTDFISGVSAGGKYIDKYAHVGSFNPGIGSALTAVANFLPGVANVSVDIGKGLAQGVAEGDWSGLSKAGGEVGQMGLGLAKGVGDLATDVATVGGLAPYTTMLEHGIKDVTGYQPGTLRQYAMKPGQGLLGAALNDVMIASMGADGANAIASSGDIGSLASGAKDAADLAQREAVDKGLSGDQINDAGSRQAAADKIAQEASPQDWQDLSQRIQARMATLDRIEGFKGGVQQLLNPVKSGGAIFQLGRAANENLAGVGGVTAGPEAPTEKPPTVELPQENIADIVKEAVNKEHANARFQQEAQRATTATKTLFRGEGLDHAEGSHVVDPGTGPWYTDNAETAARYANGGKVLRVEVPEELAQATSDHPSPDGGMTYDLGKHPDGGRFDNIARVLAEPEQQLETSQDATHANPQIERTPAEYKSFIERSKPVPEWAKAAVDHMPDIAKQLLKWSDDLRLRYDTFRINRQNERVVAVNARRIEQLPEFQAVKAAINDIVHERLPDIKPAVANAIITDMIRAHSVLPEGLWESLEQNRDALDLVEPGLADRILDRRVPVPEQLNTPEFRTQVRTLAEPIRQLYEQVPEEFRANARVGEKGNFDTEQTLTRKDLADLKQAADISERAAKLITDKVPAERQAALDQVKAFQDEIMRRIESRQSYIRVQNNLNNLITTLTDHMLPSEIAASGLEADAEDLRQAVSDRVANRTPPPIWQPFVRAASEMSEAVLHYPELEELFEPLAGIMDDALGYAESIGWTPTYMPEMTEDRVRQLVNGTARLGGRLGEEFTSGGRKERTGALNRLGGDARNFDMLVAGLNQALQEKRTNFVVDWADRVVATDIPRDESGRRTGMPRNMMAWDGKSGLRTRMLSFLNPEGERVPVSESTQMIPKAVGKLFREYEMSDNPFSRAMAKITNPWKSYMLTLNPAFYGHHVIGHAVLALLNETGGVRLSDWTGAITEARTGFANMPEVTGLSIAKNELGDPGLIKYNSIGDAIYHEGPAKGIVHYLADKIHNGVNVSDSFARAVVYLSDIRDAGYTLENAPDHVKMEALQHASDALVDYQNLSPTERYFARAIIPFYGFEKGVLKVALNMPFDHPLVAATMIQLGRVQGEQAKDDNGNPLPPAYQGVVAGINLQKWSPFKDLAGLTTPDGIVSNLQYAIQAVVRSGLGVAAPGTKAGTKVDAYGRVVPDVSLGSQLASSVLSGPGQVVGTGDWLKFLGINRVSDQTLNNAGQRNVLSQAEVANAPQALQQQAARNPIDTQLLQSNLQQAVASGSALTPPSGAGQQPTITQAQLQTAVQQAVDAQKQKAAETRALKGGSRRSSRRGGGSSRRFGSIGRHHASFNRMSGGGGGHTFRTASSASGRSRIRSSFKAHFKLSTSGSGGQSLSIRQTSVKKPSGRGKH